MATQMVRTTLTIPAALIEEIDLAVQAGKARSRNELVIQAVKTELAAQRRSAIDAAFAEMANDPEYLAESRKIMEEFEGADRASFQEGERAR